jgi:hypothetical protein
MTTRADTSGEMFGSWIDADTADRLLDGAIDPDDAPPGYRGVAVLVSALRSAPDASELAALEDAVAGAMAIREGGVIQLGEPRRSRRSFRLKVAALAFVGALLGTSGLAFAGVLPQPIQDAAAEVLSTVGIEVPSSTDHPASTGEEISETATTTDATGVDKGAEISEQASGGISQAGEHGADVEGSGSADRPVGPGSSPADEASGGRNEVGQDAAADHGTGP